MYWAFSVVCDIGIGVWISFLWYVDCVQQLWESSGGHVFAVVPDKWAIWCSQPYSFLVKTLDSCFHHMQTLFVVCGREHCPTTMLTFFHLWTNMFCLFRCIESFPYCSISESDCFNFYLLSFLLYLDSVCQVLGSYGGHILVVDPIKWATLCRRAECLQFEA